MIRVIGRVWSQPLGFLGRARARDLIVPLAAAVVVAMLFFFSSGFFRAIEFKLLDEHFRLRGQRVPTVPVQIVAIDDASLERLGRWPWPRTVLARLITTLADVGARVVCVDVILTEPDQSTEQLVAAELLQRYRGLGVARSGEPAQQFERELEDLRDRTNPDRTLAAAIQRAPVVLAAFFLFPHEAGTQPGPEPSTPLSKFGFMRLRSLDQPSLWLPTGIKAIEPLPEFAAAATNLGHVNILPDPDGTVRRETLVLQHRDHYYPSLALQVAKVALGVPDHHLMLDLNGTIQVGPVSIPTDVEGRMLLNFVGPSQSFPRHSAADVLSGAIPGRIFQDAIVLIGATATGIFDLRVTPFSTVFPGVELHATTVENILSRTFLQRPHWVEVFVFGAILTLPFGIAVCLAKMRPLGGGILVATTLVGLFGLAQALLMFGGLWLPVFFPMIAVAATYIPITVHRALTEERQRLFIRRAFQQYVPEGVVSQIVANPALLRFGGERRALTIMFTDVRAFTTYSERHRAEQVVDILHEYLTRMVEVVFRNGGTLDKFIGDGVMAIFGAPVPQPDHAARACRTALQMMVEWQELYQQWNQEGKEPFSIGIGVNTGEVIVGNLGSDQRFDYTVLGDPVNVAARMESLNKDFPEASGIIISEFTYDEVRDEVEVRPLGEVVVKGRVKPITVYELLRLKVP